MAQRPRDGGMAALQPILERVARLAQSAPRADVDAAEAMPTRDTLPRREGGRQRDAQPVCPQCEGRGWLIVADGGNGTAQRCPCSAKEILPRLEAEAGIPERYRGCKLENFQPTGRHRNQLLGARTLATRWVEEFLGDDGRFRDSGLLFIGPPGVGKTHLAAAALAELLRRYRVRGRFVDFTTLIYQIQSTFDSSNPETKASVLDPVVNAEVLVLDELGAQKPTPWVSEVLYLVLNGRYTRRLPTLFTTNYYLEPPPAPPGQVDPGERGLDRGPDRAAAVPGTDLLSHRIPAMLVSRLYEMARPVVIDSVDYRQLVKSHQHR